MLNKPLGEAVQDAVTIVQASSDEGMYQLFSDRLSQKMTNLSNVSDVQRSRPALTCLLRSDSCPVLFQDSSHSLEEECLFHQFVMVSENVGTKIQPCGLTTPNASPIETHV